MRNKLVLALCLYSSIVLPVKLQQKMIGRKSLKSVAKSALVGGASLWAGLSAVLIGMGYLFDGSDFKMSDNGIVFIVASGAMGVPVGVFFGSVVGVINSFENTYNRAVNLIVQHEAKKMLADSTVHFIEYNQAILLRNQLFALQDLKWLSKNDYADLIIIIEKLEQVIDEMGLTLEKTNK